MDDTRFDNLTKRFANPTTRRAALRLLAGGLLAALVPASAARAAQRADTDGDGLFDDDETNLYGTDPTVFDTDCDGVGDGEEDFLGTDPLDGDCGAAAPAPCPAGQFDCGAGCVDLASDALNCGACGVPCDTANGHYCSGGFCTQPVAPTCSGLGGACAQYSDCCPVVEHLLCCIDANGAGTCTDVAADGSFLCPARGVPDTGCGFGMTDCGGFCTDLSIDHGNCGVCGKSCPFGSNCTNGACVVACSGGLTNCGGTCVDLSNDRDNCGACGFACPDLQFACTNGACVETCIVNGSICISSDHCCSRNCEFAFCV